MLKQIRRYGIPAYTYEVGDTSDTADFRLAAREFERSLKGALPILAP